MKIKFCIVKFRAHTPFHGNQIIQMHRQSLLIFHITFIICIQNCLFLSTRDNFHVDPAHK